MRLPFGWQITKQTVTETHVHVTVTLDGKTLATLIKRELLQEALRNPASAVTFKEMS